METNIMVEESVQEIKQEVKRRQEDQIAARQDSENQNEVEHPKVGDNGIHTTRDEEEDDQSRRMAASSLVRPCLERIAQHVVGRKYGKLQGDIESLLERLDTLLVLDEDGVESKIASSVKEKDVNLENLTEDDVEELIAYKGYGPPLADGAAREVMLVLRDAIDTRKGAVIDAALDCLQKLVAFSFVQGTVCNINHKRDVGTKSSLFQDGSKGVKPPLQFAAQPPQAQAVEMICSSDDLGEESVDLRLLKALLTVVTSISLQVHSQALLFCVRSAYNVFLTTKSPVTQATAKATLIQIINVVFQRLETGSLVVTLPPIAVADVLVTPGVSDGKASSSTTASVQQFLTDIASSVDPFGIAAANLQAELDEAFVPSKSSRTMVDGPASPVHMAWSQKQRISDVPGTYQTTETNGEKGFVEDKFQDSNVKMDAIGNVLERDGFLVLRALCKLSIRSPDATSNESTVTKGKLLALELIKILLDNSGSEFRSRERMILGIKQYLCLSLLKCCGSSSSAVQSLCASIFTTLLKKFRTHLKAEIGVFYPMIFLKSIETPVGGMSMDSSMPTLAMAATDAIQKSVILKCLEQVSIDGQLLVDLFVNYDCDLESVNLFERTIAATVRLAQGGHASSGIDDLPEVRQMRFEALLFLKYTLSSLGMWHYHSTHSAKEKEDEEKTSKAGEVDVVIEDGMQVVKEIEDDVRSKWMAQLAAGQRSLPQLSGGKQGDLVKVWKEFKRAFEKGVSLFNEKPKKGIEFMQSQKLVGAGPDEVARFLSVTQALDKTMIGDYLGERDDYNIRVMHAYVDDLDFAGLEFDASIRKFLAGFRLPGEAQKIDRLMEKFAERFVRCNPEAFKSADVAYVLAYSVIMLNTDAHNPMVKSKMTKNDFLRNNRGINDGGDLDPNFMEALYDRIVENEIKMKGSEFQASVKDEEIPSGQVGWFDSVMALIPGRQRAASTEPADEAVKRIADKLRELAEGASYFEARDGDAIRPMIDVSWAPVLGAFSVLFESEQEQKFIDACIEGFKDAIVLMSRLEMLIFRNAFISSLKKFTSLNVPSRIGIKNVKAFRTLVQVAEEIGDTLFDDWPEILRCVSRFELVRSLGSGVPTDASLFTSMNNGIEREHAISSSNEIKLESSNNMADMRLQAFTKSEQVKLSLKESALPSQDTLKLMEFEDLTRFYVSSVKLDSESIVAFVKALCAVALEELGEGGPPRVFSLTQIVEIAHFNMGRIRLVWGRIWSELSPFFVNVGCHESLAVSMYAVDSLRQLSMKFLTRDELANYNFQNDFLRPYVILVRRSKNAEIRELVIRCVSQMVLARASNIKSGWKSVFMVFTCAATDKSPHVVRLAFSTVERIVREHFEHITETETTTFTDCVNCLVAFTNNPHSLDVSLNAIAFLRFCAGELAEGDINVQAGELPIDAKLALNVDAHRIRPVGSRKSGTPTPAAAAAAATAAAVIAAATPEPTTNRSGIRFTDKDEHMYFWFPLLAGLSELTFDPRSEIRYGALGVLFDILKLHGYSFTREFWIRVYDSILLPMFDHVRAEVTDTTTFSDDARRAEADAWLYETCTTSLQYLVDLVSKYQKTIPELLTRSMQLLAGFIRRNHPSLAAVGVAALTQLSISCGSDASKELWNTLTNEFESAANDTYPDLAGLLEYRATQKANHLEAADDRSSWSLGDGAGARRLSEIHCRSSVQLLLAQACGELYAAHSKTIPIDSAMTLLNILRKISDKSMEVDADESLRHSLTLAQTADKVAPNKFLRDPPFLHLEVESAQAYMSVLMSISVGGRTELVDASNVENRISDLCLSNLERFERQSALCQNASAQDRTEALKEENAALAPLAVATLKCLVGLSKDAFAARVKDFYPILTNLIASDVAPPEVQSLLSELFSERISNMIS